MDILVDPTRNGGASKTLIYQKDHAKGVGGLTLVFYLWDVQIAENSF